MEKRLERLFDYQRFEDTPSLRQVIDSVHTRYAARALDLEEMNWVNAAGMPVDHSGKKEKEDR